MDSSEDGADEGQAVKEGAAAGETPAGAGTAKAVPVADEIAARLADAQNKLLYLQADFENYRKRVARKKAEYRAAANEGLITELLDVYENLGRALEAAGRAPAQGEPISKGLAMVYGDMKAVMERHGLKPIEAVGRPFDPRTMEALMQEVSEAEEGTVLEEFQRGYTLNSKVIRCAKVKVSRK